MNKLLPFYFTVFFVFIFCFLFAQNKSEADSLQELLKKNLHDTVRLQVLTDLHWAYITSNIEKPKK